MDRWAPIVENIPEWVQSYFDGAGQVDDLAKEFEDIPDKASEVAKNAPNEFAELEFMAKAKMIKAVVGAVSKIKDKCEQVLDDMKTLKGDSENIKELIKQLKEDIDNGKLLELAKKCKAAGKVTSKDCYECAFEVIKDPAKGKKGGKQNGCCTIY